MSEEVRRYRKRPVEIDAIRYDGNNGREITEWAGGNVRVVSEMHAPTVLAIYTLEGVMKADVGDYVIREPFPTGDRQFYPCKPDIFEQTYEEVR